MSAVLLGLVASSAAAETVIDQEYVAPPTVGYELDDPGDYMAQTFTARNSGQITSIALQLSLESFQASPASVTDDLHFMLTHTNAAGEPVPSDVLATQDIGPFDLTLDYSGLPMHEIDLQNQNIQVRAGDVLALVLTSSYTYYSHPEHQNYKWNNSLWFDQISGGRFYVYSPQVFGPRWFYQWNTTDPTLTADAGYRITIATVPEPSPLLLGVLGIFALSGRLRRGPHKVC